VKPFVVIHAEQRSPEWLAARLGRLTASAAKDMLATVRSGEAAARRDLRMRLVCERLTGRLVEDDHQNADMRRGVEMEPEARAAYEARTGELVTECGFLSHIEHMAGCSPDGVMGDFDGGVELKAPRPATHFRYLREGKVPAEHVPQLLHTLWVTGAAFWDFASYSEAFPPHLQLFVVRYERDEKAVAEYSEKALAFLREVDLEESSAMGLRLLEAV
jgi:hypothetical protein